jgi:lysophospholipase L1-like esterase
MARMRVSAVLRAALIASLVACLGVAIWKMLDFHARLHALENPQWEETLAKEHLDGAPIVLFGDSQIANWPLATSFGVLTVLDRGVVGDFATKASSRFRRDVLPLNPKLVVILIGTNDLAQRRSVESILRSIEEMVQSARKQNAAVILCSLLPARGASGRIRPREQIELINSGLRALAAAQGASYLDLYSAVVNERGEFAETFSDDGLHPNLAGYRRMTRALLPQLLQAYATRMPPEGVDAATGVPGATRP